ncbi:hypothetical protein H2248_002697 [Termitomyces sp. 'cryptogamus']|nr:hypothetical protein H2248_002697 [Termitomyces sp. 'cryptogamus']
MCSSYSLLTFLCVFAALGRAVKPEAKHGAKIVLTNDDGWAVAQIRSEYDALKAAGYKVVLSAPANNRSGTGSSTATPTPLTQPCEFDTCPTGSPAVGFNVSDPFINYVNAFPVDAARYGIQTLSPKLLGSNPDLVISGSNIGNNLGFVVGLSGTVGAAAEAALEGIPSVAFSGASGAQVSYTTLESDPTAASSIAAGIYTKLSLKFIKRLLSKNHGPILPTNISLNVNYPAIDNCTSTNAFKFVFTRINVADNTTTDIDICSSRQLPDETSVIATAGCYASVSVFSATNKSDVSATTQAFVYKKLKPILSCLH